MSLAIDSTIRLSRGNLPRLGLGVYKARGDECTGACITAIQAGYKHSVYFHLFDNALERIYQYTLFPVTDEC